MDYSKKNSTFAFVMRNLPTVTRYILVANLIVFLLTAVLQRYGLDLNAWGGLHYITASSFHWWQPFTYMFLHANLSHLFFNMFAVWMFGPVIEQKWGERRYALYYLVCGLGAAIVQEGVWAAMLANMSNHYAVEAVANYAYYMNTIGASGAVFGILFAFGWLFPDVPMYILFVPIPIRARIFVMIYAAIELFAGLGSVAGLTADHVAHFAHLGGMFFGWLLILYWKHKKSPKHLDSTQGFEHYHYQKRVDD